MHAGSLHPLLSEEEYHSFLVCQLVRHRLVLLNVALNIDRKSASHSNILE